MKGRLLAALTAALLTSGCSTAQWRNVGMGIGDFTTTWTIGSCHRLDRLEETDPVFPSDTSPAVPCDSSHESETYAVVPITGAVAAQHERPSPLWLQQAVKGACGWASMVAYLGGGPIDALRNISILQIAPSEPEWERGVRTLRCDVLLGPRSSAGVASISRPLHEILAVPAGDRFRVCRVNGQEVGCDQPHDAELIDVWMKVPMKASVKASTKSVKAQETAKLRAFCKPKALQYLGVSLSARPHVAVIPELSQAPSTVLGQCWLGDTTPGRQWVGSLRSGVRRLP